MPITLNIIQQKALEENQRSLLKNQKNKSVLDDTILVADSVNQIPTWKISKLNDPTYYCHLPSSNYLEVYDATTLYKYSNGIFSSFMEDPNVKEILNLIEKELLPYSKIHFKLQSTEGLTFNHQIEIFSVPLLQLDVGLENLIPIKIDFFAIKNMNMVELAKSICESLSLRCSIHLTDNYKEMVRYIDEIQTMLNEKKQLENNIDDKTMNKKIKI